MYSKKKIVAFTGIRSDYDLLSYLYKKLSADPNVEFKLLVYGAHLSKKFGFSVKEIEADKLEILAKIENLPEVDSMTTRPIAAAGLLSEAAVCLSNYRPDMILYAGDREDALIAATVAGYLRIPGIHFFGGDHATDGNIDNPIRHAVSKLSTFHFVATEKHKRRLISIGEPEKRIFVSGSPSLDKLLKEPVMLNSEIVKSFSSLNEWPIKKTALLTYHPMYGEEDLGGLHISEIIDSLLKKDYFIFCNSPNIDVGNSKIFDAINKYQDNKNVQQFKNLDRNKFVNLLRNVDLLIGNSSAGIIEAATLKKAVINVGNRQLGRDSSDNVVFCKNSRQDILNSISYIESDEFKKKLLVTENIYGDGKAIDKIAQVLLSTDFLEIIEKREDPL